MKREVNYLLIGGISGIVLAFGIAFLFENPWVGYAAALIIGFLVLFLADRWIVSKLKVKPHRMITRILFTGLILLHTAILIRDYRQADWQKENLAATRDQMFEMLALSETHDLLVKSLRHYVDTSGLEVSSLESSFRTVAGDRLSGDGTLQPKYGGDENPLRYRVEIAESDSILIYVEESGDLSENGSLSHIAILTPNGVRYE